ncbi:MAG: DUF7482 domain-containing protein [Scandinavium sp.]|uniref:DUF7482 domain-containing protein n=1 Tax=Scandinavium sp. TaxID=2830653 RepID=UPI003F2E5ED7
MNLKSTISCCITAALLPVFSAHAVVVARGQEGIPLEEGRTAPPSIFPDEHVITAQPSPSEINPSFLGPVLLMKSGQVDLVKGTVTLPLYEGKLESGETVWSIITDVSDQQLAQLHGAVFSAKMAYGITDDNARMARVEQSGAFIFNKGKVDFSPGLSITPGNKPDYFPPKHAQAGSVGDADYTPMVKIAGGSAVYNMPTVAENVSAEKLNTMCDGNVDHTLVHDKVVRICPKTKSVTLNMTLGYTFGKPVFYISTDSNDKTIAALETSTYTPALSKLPFSLEDASPGEFAERIYAFANGPVGINNPFRQGVNSALSDKGSHGPLNVLGGIPTINLDYSPMWRLFPVKWTKEAIAKGYRTKLTNAFDIENAAEKGLVVSLVDGKAPKAAGIIINCPVVYRIN